MSQSSCEWSPENRGCLFALNREGHVWPALCHQAMGPETNRLLTLGSAARDKGVRRPHPLPLTFRLLSRRTMLPAGISFESGPSRVAGAPIRKACRVLLRAQKQPASEAEAAQRNPPARPVRHTKQTSARAADLKLNSREGSAEVQRCPAKDRQCVPSSQGRPVARGWSNRARRGPMMVWPTLAQSVRECSTKQSRV